MTPLHVPLHIPLTGPNAPPPRPRRLVRGAGLGDSMTPKRRAMVCRPDGDMPGVYRIEWAEHDGRVWEETRRVDYGFGLVSVVYTGRSSNLEPYNLVYGSLGEMQDLAAAILAGGEAEYKRCAVRVNPDGMAAFWNPRSSNGVEAVVHGDDARDLARSILGIGATP